MQVTEAAMQDFILAQREQIAELCRKHHVRRLSVFGSAARDDFDSATSDVDVVIEFDLDRIPDGTYSDNKWAFHDELVRSFGRKVDLLTWASVRNKYLLRERFNDHTSSSMRRDPAFNLSTILDMAECLLAMAANHSREEYLVGRDLQLAAERVFIIIGEAMVLLKKHRPTSMPSWNHMLRRSHSATSWFIGTGDIDHQDVWLTLTSEMPSLKDAVDQLIDRLEPGFNDS